MSNQLVVIIGSTAVGKTALSLQLAAQYNSEILSADSRLFYRHMNIGTAKPTAAEMGDVKHHFIDIADPDETITVGHYQRECYNIIDTLHRQKKLPILVGGTGQYVQAVIEGWGIPAVPPQPLLRAKLALREPIDLHHQLSDLDPIAANKLHPNNKRRVIRALEVCIISGKPITELQRKNTPPYEITIIGLRGARDWLYARIDQRVDEMIEAGLVEEVERLVAMGYGRKTPAMSALGYPQLLDYIDGVLSFDQAIDRIKYETHRFVRHQYNWFETRMNDVTWIDVITTDYPMIVFDHVHRIIG